MMIETMMKKRKQVEDDDLHPFSLSSPALKIRRLQPVMEDVDHEISPSSSACGYGFKQAEEGEERAIVLYKPQFHSQSQQLYPNFSVSVDSDLISGFKNQFLRSSGNNNVKIEPVEQEEEEIERDAKSYSMAVVPWVPSNQLNHMQSLGDESQTESMEAEQNDVAAMEIEGNTATDTTSGQWSGIGEPSGRLPPWQQQHCFIPNLPYNTSTPISWFH